MIEIVENEKLNTQDWIDNGKAEVIFSFRNGAEKTIEIKTEGMNLLELDDLKNQLIGKQKLLKTIFEHGTHGQITVQGLTVRADDLISMWIR